MTPHPIDHSRRTRPRGFTTRDAARRPALGVWLLTAVLVLAAPPPLAALAQAEDGGAWWARVSAVDVATACAAEAAWAHAMDVEYRAEFDLTTAPLAAVLAGAELARVTQSVGALEEQGHGLARAETQAWRVVGGTSDELVLYVSYTRRLGYQEPSSAYVDDQQWTEAGQAAYRVVRQAGVWRVADQHVFEQTHRTIDPATFDEVTRAYLQLWSTLAFVYNARDLAGLETVLTGTALDTYRARVQSLVDTGDDTQLPGQGSASVIDVSDGTALVYFKAPLEPPQQVDVLQRLQLDDGQWKIVDEFGETAHTNADGSVRIDGCVR